MIPLYIPYTQLREATAVFLHQVRAYEPGYRVNCVDLSSGNGWGYLNHLQQCWEAGETFLNLEHDVVPWPGALDSLTGCDRPWCFFHYLPGIDEMANRTAVFGLVKFDASLIAALPEVWQDMRVVYAKRPQPWRYCDVFFFDYATERGFRPHQHYPPVVNANPVVLKHSGLPVSPTASSPKGVNSC